ncbi:MAG: hypothetical protein WC718_18730, partial [Phycisphaerales bacterium]
MNIKHALVLAAMAGLSCSAAMAQNDLRLAEVYGGGGATTGTPTYKSDFVVIFNGGASARSLAGASLQYTSATGTGTWFVLQLPAVSIPAGRYYLVQTTLAPAANVVGADLTGQDFSANNASGFLNLSATTGKIALVSDTVALAGPTPGGATIVDLVGYGPGATAFEGSGAVGVLTNASAALRNMGGCSDTNNNAADFTVGPTAILNSMTAANICSGTGFNDCNGNGVNDADEIAANASIDCNNNGVIDTCEITATNDRDGNGVLDSCQIAADPSLDCNTNGILDSVELSTTPFLDSNGNGQIDSCETPGAGQDCNTNGRLDSWDLLVGELTDVNGNGTPDACEGAAVAEVTTNGTVQPAPFGTRSAPNGDAFLNVEGEANNTFASYGGLRFDLAPVATQFDAAYGAANWHVTKAYLFLQQSNAAFTVNGTVRIYWSNNDTLNITPGTTSTVFGNFDTDFADRELVADYNFTQGTGITIGSAQGNGTTESHLLFDEAGGNAAGGQNTANELNSGAGSLT